MIKNKFISLISSFIILTFSLQSTQADPSPLEDEFDHFLEYGLHSKNFYSNIQGKSG